MGRNELKNAYDHLRMTKEMDQEVLKMITEGKKNKVKRFPGRWVAVAASAAIVLGMFQIPSVKVAAINLIEKIAYRVSWGEGSEADLSIEEKAVNGDLPTESVKYDTLSEAEKVIGIDFLRSDKEYTDGGNLIEYTTEMNENGDIYGIWLQDDFYSLGDITDVSVQTTEKPDVGNMIEYKQGEVYKTPIGMQLAILTDNAKAQEGGLLGFSGMKAVDISKAEGFIDAEDYHIASIDEDAVVATMEGEGIGPATWESDGHLPMTATIGVFTHDGVEYLFMAETTHEGMIKFLETLQ